MTKTLADQIREFCSARSIRPQDLSRDVFRSETGQPGIASRGWSQAKAEASQGATPAPPVEVLPPGHKLKGVSTLVGPDGETRIQWIKTTTDPESQEQILAKLLETIPGRIPDRGAPVPPPTETLRSDLLAVYPMGDPHIGMLSWGVETGADFDLQIAEDLMVRAIRDLVSRGPRTHTALLVNLGDFFHYDNDNARTTQGGHTLDVDGRAAKVLVIGLRIMVTMIDALLSHHAAVEVRNKIGNHDGHSALLLAIALKAHYRSEPRVSIPIEPQHRSYFRWYRNLIGMTHGDRARGEDLGEIMAAERPEDWGQTAHRSWLVGHVHHSTVKEYRGCRVETFRTLAARDSWHARQGYQSGRDMHRITLHREHGEIGREVASVGWLMSGEAA